MAPDLSLPEGYDRIIEALSELPLGKRTLVAIAGAPGSGKSTISERLAIRLNQIEPDRAAVLPMDGYHFDDNIIHAMGRLANKGAPDTFDVAGLLHMLRRLKDNTEDSVAVPVFDRSLEVARGAARLIRQSTDIILVEGNYLLSTEAPWSALAPLFDFKVLLEVPDHVLRERLIARWRDLGHSDVEAARRADGNDMPNGKFVRDTAHGPDVVLHAAA